jgi:hypothetical protein
LVFRFKPKKPNVLQSCSQVALLASPHALALAPPAGTPCSPLPVGTCSRSRHRWPPRPPRSSDATGGRTARTLLALAAAHRVRMRRGKGRTSLLVYPRSRPPLLQPCSVLAGATPCSSARDRRRSLQPRSRPPPLPGSCSRRARSLLATGRCFPLASDRHRACAHSLFARPRQEEVRVRW